MTTPYEPASPASAPYQAVPETAPAATSSAPETAPAATSSAPETAPAATGSVPQKESGRSPGDFVKVRHDNGRGTLTETTALVVRSVDVPDVKTHPSGAVEQLDTTHVEYEVVPVTTMRVAAEHLVDEEG